MDSEHECIKVSCFNVIVSLVIHNCFSLLVKQIFLIGAVLMYDISCGLDNIPIVGLHSFWCLALFVAQWLQSSVS